MKERVVVTGIGVVSALGPGKNSFLQGLREGQSGIKKLKHYNTDELFLQGGEVAEVSDETAIPDRASRMLRLALREALTDSGLLSTLPLRVGAAVGSAQGGLKTGEKIHALIEENLPVEKEMWKEYPLGRLLFHIKSEIQLTGPEVVISNACVSSTMALGVALEAIRDGLADAMIVAGVDSMTRFVSAGFQSLKAVTGDKCKPFDKNRDGIIPGEGAGVIILEREKMATKRGAQLYGELTGYGSASDAVHMTAPDRDGGGAYLAIKQALKEAGIKPDEIDYLLPHGTGTMYNDAMEYVALCKVFGSQAGKKPLSSVKSTFGHTMGAAGIFSAITALLAIKHSFLPVNLNFETPDEDLPLNVVTKPGISQNNRHVLIMTSAFGGSNAVAIFSKLNDQRECEEGLL